MQPDEQADRIHKAIQVKIEQMAAAIRIPSWRFHLGQVDGVEEPSFDDSGWETTKLMKTWSSADGEAWFRTTLNIPDEVDGIALAGSRLELEVFLAIGATIYVNGVEVFREAFWTDSRAVLLVLAEDYRLSGPLTIVVRCNAGDGFGLFLLANLRFSVLDRALFELDLVRSQLSFTSFLMTGRVDARVGTESTRPTAGGPVDTASQAQPRAMESELVDAWQGAANALDLDALAASQWLQWDKSVADMRTRLSPFAVRAKTYRAALIAHSHIDMNWLWPWRETVEVCRRDFNAADALMSRYPEFHFSQSMAAAYAAIEEQQPELFSRIRERVKEGRWDITANTWVEGDLNMAAGETLVRQILHTRRYIVDRFGVEPTVCWEPDTFGHTANYPQILAKSGIKHYYFCRAGKRHPLFWWQGIDGSRVLAVQDPRGYGGENNPSDVVGSVIDFAARYGLHTGLYVFGAGDHGGGATARDIEYARRIDAAPFVPHAVSTTSQTFFEQAAAEAPVLPVVTGELNTVFEGCYTSHADIKRMNRECENGLLTAEAAATVASILTGANYPLADLAEAWRTVCFHQFHDILDGCAIGVTYREARERLVPVIEKTQAITANAVAALAAAVNIGEDDRIRVVVFNPSAWARSDVARVPVSAFQAGVPTALEDEEGRVLHVQVVDDNVIFVAEVPAFGMRVYRSTEMTLAADSVLSIANTDNTLDNGSLRLHVNPLSGAIDGLIDLQAGRDLAGPWSGWGPEAKVSSGMINRLQIAWEQPHPMSAWNIGDITHVDHLVSGAEVRVTERGPVRGVIEVRRQVLHSHVTQRIVLYRGIRRIDFETTVDWHEKGNAHDDAPMLQAAFTPFLEQTQATFEVAFAGIERPADGREVPALRWIDVSEAGYGVSLLNDCKYGHSVHGNTLGITLIRASYEPDNNPDEGLHQFCYSLYPHQGDWRKANTERHAVSINQPLQAVTTSGHMGKLHAGRPWLECSAPNVAVSAVKFAEDQPSDGQAVIVRVYEAHGQPARAKLQPGWRVIRAEEVDMIERPLRNLQVRSGSVHVSLRPHEIKSLKLFVRP